MQKGRFKPRPGQRKIYLQATAEHHGGLGGVRVAVHGHRGAGQQGVEHALALVGGGGAQVGGLA